jgi:hypothetical protein
MDILKSKGIYGLNLIYLRDFEGIEIPLIFSSFQRCSVGTRRRD